MDTGIFSDGIDDEELETLLKKAVCLSIAEYAILYFLLIHLSSSYTKQGNLLVADT